MNKKGLVITLLQIAAISFALTSCRRSAGEVVEDTRSAGRYVGKGLRSLVGNTRDSKQIDNPDDFTGPGEDQYLPLSDEDLYGHEGEITSGGNIYPQALDSPGEMGSSLPGIEGFKDPIEMNVSQIFQHIHFDTDDHIVRGQQNHATVRAIAQYLQKHPNIFVFVEGHCDERASAAYNLALGARRSNSVREELIKEKVDMNRLFTISYGKERPLALGHTPQDWKKNRRVQFKLYAKR